MRKYFIFFLLILVADLTVSFFQYYNTYIDGDLSAVALPAYWYSDVLKDPFGFSAILNNKTAGGMGRFFSHYSTFWYYQHIPQFLQNFVSPITSVYLASALFMLFTHILAILFLSILVTGKNNPLHKDNLIASTLFTVFFQFTYNYEVMGVVDHAADYVFAYLWSMVFIILIYIPFYRLFFVESFKGFSLPMTLGLLFIYTCISFGSPLSAPVCLLWNGLIGIALLINIKAHKAQKLDFQKQLLPLILLVLFCIISLYDFYLGRYNTENITNNAAVGLARRYLLLTKGFAFMCTHTFGFSLLVIGVLFNFIVHYKIKSNYLTTYKWLLVSSIVFVTVYLLLLPLGGYREYRHYIIRYDTFIPVSLIIIWLFAHSAWHLWNSSFEKKKLYTVFLVVFLLIYFGADLRIAGVNKVERKALEQIQSSNSDTIILPEKTRLLTWFPVEDSTHLEVQNEMLKVWNISSRNSLFIIYQ